MSGRYTEIEPLLRYSTESKNDADFKHLIGQLERIGRADEAHRLRIYGLEPGGIVVDSW